jgi:hypothetical protein
MYQQLTSWLSSWFAGGRALASPQDIRQHLLNDPTASREPPRDWSYWTPANDDLPLFTLWQGERMMRDPVVRFGLNVRDAALAAGEVEISGPDANEVAYAGQLWESIWGQHGYKITKAKRQGFAGFQPTFQADDRTGQLEVTGLKEFSPREVRPRVAAGQVVGMTVRPSGAGGSGQMSELLLPQCIWVTFDAEYGRAYGKAILERAYSPWVEKWMDHGAKKTIQLRMLKDAFSGLIGWHPDKETAYDKQGRQQSWRDIMRQTVENLLAGGSMTLPTIYDAEGRKLVDVTRLPDAGDPSPIFRWVEGCDEDISKAFDVPPEVIKASESGSGYSGRSIPLIMFLQAVGVEFAEYVQCIDRTIRVLVWLNTGRPPSYKITPMPLAETFARLTQGTAMGGESMGGQAGEGKQPGGMGGQPGARNPAEANGQKMLGGPAQFDEGEGKGGSKWITIGGKEKDGQKHVGGFPVEIDADGVILKSGGPKELVGKTLKEAGQHFYDQYKERRAKSDQKRYDIDREKKVGTRGSYQQIVKAQAKHWGIDEDEYEGIVDAVWKDATSDHFEREAAKKYARKLTGLDAGKVAKLEDSGFDHASKKIGKKNLDVWATEIESQYPGVLGEGTPEELWDLIKEGAQPAPSRTSEAFHDRVDDYLAYQKKAAKEWKPSKEDEEVLSMEFAE